MVSENNDELRPSPKAGLGAKRIGRKFSPDQKPEAEQSTARNIGDERTKQILRKINSSKKSRIYTERSALHAEARARARAEQIKRMKGAFFFKNIFSSFQK